ncbi:MAG: DUF2971 domain-containing protein [Sphaerochaetaceae bacterium]|nr:DUF2971 domain-containing protein [Sphaerochaetaceae bacterium]
MYLTTLDKFLQDKGFKYQYPEYLYHYTNSDALINIVENSEFWLTHIQYFNDKKEYHDGVDLILKTLTSRKDELGSELFKSLKNIFLGNQWLNKSMNVGVLSFSSKRDLLSQWRGYTKIGKGYCLGIKTNELFNQKMKVHFCRCIYHDSEKKIIVNSIIDDIIQRKKKEKSIDDIDAHAFFLFQYCSIIFKNESFFEEEEWRLITFPLANNDKNWNFRSGESTIIPYTKINIDLKRTLNEVIIGPSDNQKLSKNSLFFLLFKNDLCFNSIRYSSVPYRGL